MANQFIRRMRKQWRRAVYHTASVGPASTMQVATAQHRKPLGSPAPIEALRGGIKRRHVVRFPWTFNPRRRVAGPPIPDVALGGSIRRGRIPYRASVAGPWQLRRTYDPPQPPPDLVLQGGTVRRRVPKFPPQAPGALKRQAKQPTVPLPSLAGWIRRSLLRPPPGNVLTASQRSKARRANAIQAPPAPGRIERRPVPQVRPQVQHLPHRIIASPAPPPSMGRFKRLPVPFLALAYRPTPAEGGRRLLPPDMPREALVGRLDRRRQPGQGRATVAARPRWRPIKAQRPSPAQLSGRVRRGLLLHSGRGAAVSGPFRCVAGDLFIGGAVAGQIVP